MEEHIFHMAGAKSPREQTKASMIKAIREAGREPFQRNTFYEALAPSPSSSHAPGVEELSSTGAS